MRPISRVWKAFSPGELRITVWAGFRGSNSPEKTAGTCCWPTADPPTARPPTVAVSTRTLYPLANTANVVSEILAINSHEFLVLERDGAGGAEAVTKKIFKVDLDGATDITHVEALPADSLPPGVTPARKSPFLDFLNPAYGLA